MHIKNILSEDFKKNTRHSLIMLKDIISGDYWRLAKKNTNNIDFKFKIELVQPIRRTTYYDNKVHNILQGISRIHEVVIFPNGIFSFWQIVKKPTVKNKFKIGRNIISGKLSSDYGGGLCQLSSIIYHLSIIAGISIIERYNHSIDIYNEEDRFTPLGADATVAYGYKDLRFRNEYSFPVKFNFEIINDNLIGSICSTQYIEKREIVFNKDIFESYVKVSTNAIFSGKTILLGVSTYQLPKNNANIPT